MKTNANGSLWHIWGCSTLICVTITNTIIIGGLSQHAHLISILVTAQYGRFYYYFNLEGQQSEARETIKLPKGTWFTSR